MISPDDEISENGRPQRRRVTLQDVARAAGVSVTSTSRALHGVRNGVRAPSLATIDRVRVIAEALGYTRDQMASGLRTRESRSLGVLVPRLSDLVIATIYDGIEEAAAAAGYRTVVANTHDDPAEQRTRAQIMLDYRVDGLIISDAYVGDAFIDELADRGVPFVLVNRRVGSHLAASCDDLSGGRQVAEHLLERGHTSVAVLAGEPRASTGRDRSEGFLVRWRAEGQSVPDRWVVHGPFHTLGGRASGRSCMEQVLAQPGPTPSAVFAVSDLMAIGAMDAICNAGLRIGADIAVVGFNDISFAADLQVPLSSVASPLLEMGRSATNLLLEVLAGDHPESHLMPTELMIRASSSLQWRLPE